jgi:hypothetical protein
MKVRWLKPDSDWTWSGKSMRRKDEVLGQGSELRGSTLVLCALASGRQQLPGSHQNMHVSVEATLQICNYLSNLQLSIEKRKSSCAKKIAAFGSHPLIRDY